MAILLLMSCRRHRSYEDDNLHIDTTSTVEEVQDSSIIQVPLTGLEIPAINDDAVPGQILKREVYTTCYNHDTRCPNWVAWVLTREKAQGTTEKKIWYDENGCAIGISDFAEDMVRGGYIYDAEADEPRPELKDWIDRPDNMSHGHMCPAMDCKISPAAMTQSFLLTNLCVQADNLNQGSWRQLEIKCHDLAIKCGCLYIVAGPVFHNGQPSAYMGKSRIAIPDAFYKVVLCMEGNPKAIGFVYANTNDKHNMQDAVRTVDQIEELTGIDFFPILPDDMENEIESHANLNDWQ